MFKVGDRVTIIKKSNKKIVWHKDMDKSIGTYGIIVNKIDHMDCYNVLLDYDTIARTNYGTWCYDEESLEVDRVIKLKKILCLE